MKPTKPESLGGWLLFGAVAVLFLFGAPIDTATEASRNPGQKEPSKHSTREADDSEHNRLVPVTARCVRYARKRFDVPARIILTVLSVENGKVGRVSTNPNGTLDHGPGQINSVWLPVLNQRFDITQVELTNNGCLNVQVLAWIMRRRMDQSSSTWTAIGHYHSFTSRHARRYRNAFHREYRSLDPGDVLQSVNATVSRHEP